MIDIQIIRKTRFPKSRPTVPNYNIFVFWDLKELCWNRFGARHSARSSQFAVRSAAATRPPLEALIDECAVSTSDAYHITTSAPAAPRYKTREISHQTINIIKIPSRTHFIPNL